MNNKLKTVFVTGGAGYVGAALVPALLKYGYRVKVLDLYMYGDDVLSAVRGNPGLEEIKGDMRDVALLRRVIPGSEAVIHLACISNDPEGQRREALHLRILVERLRHQIRAKRA
jgi:nucleoside-diphosphate-sugar epimerase